MTRGEVWLAKVGGKTRPVVVLTRPEVIDVRRLVTVAEISSTLRGLATEVQLDHREVGLDRDCAINCDGLHTMEQSTLIRRVGSVDDLTLANVCWAVNYSLGC